MLGFAFVQGKELSCEKGSWERIWLLTLQRPMLAFHWFGTSSSRWSAGENVSRLFGSNTFEVGVVDDSFDRVETGQRPDHAGFKVVQSIPPDDDTRLPQKDTTSIVLTVAETARTRFAVRISRWKRRKQQRSTLTPTDLSNQTKLSLLCKLLIMKSFGRALLFLFAACSVQGFAPAVRSSAELQSETLASEQIDRDSYLPEQSF